MSFLTSKERSITLPSHHRGNLYDGIDICLRKDPLSPGTFDIEAQDPQWSDFQPVAFRCVGNQILIAVLI